MSILVEGMQQNLQTAARFYTEQNDLVVKFSNTTATDMKKTIFLQHHKGEIIPGTPAGPAECWVVMKAGNAHESAHIIFSHRRAWERACSKGRLYQHIVNILEDSRIEKAVSNIYPGTKLWLRFTNEYFFKNRKFNSSGLKGFLDGLLCYAVVGLVPEGMDDKVNEVIEDCMDYVDEARNAESTWDVLKYSEKILEIAAKAFPEVESLEKSEGFKGTDNPMSAPNGDEDPRRVVKRKSKSKKRSSEDEKSSSGDAKGEAEGSTGKGEDKEEPEDKPASAGEPSSDSKDSDKPEDKPEEKEAGSSSEEKPEEEPEESSSEETKEDEKPSDEPDEKPSEEPGEKEKHDEKPDETEEETGEEPDKKSAGDKPEDKEDEELDSSPEDTGESEKPDEPESPGDESEDTGESNDEPEDSEPEVDGESEEFDEPEDDGEPEGSKPEEEGSFPEDDPEEEFPEGDIPDTIPDDDPEMDEVLETAETELRTIEVDAERKVRAAEEEEPEEVNYEKLAKEISKDAIHRGVGFQLRQKKPNPSDYYFLVKKLSGPIKNLVEEIRKALEFRDTVPRRCLKKGHLDPGALWKIRVPSPEVFYRREEPGDVPVLAVKLQVDCSGSMSGPNMSAANEAAVVLHETCNRLKIQHSVDGFTSLMPYGDIVVTHYKAVDWNEKDGSKIASLHAESENRDGYSIRIAAGELEIRPEPVKLMIVLSDGMPADMHYHGESAIADTIRSVRDAEKKGIKVIGIYFGEESDIEHAKQIYNYLVFCRDINSLPTVLGRVLKKALLG